ncbi:MAG TPA: hypothetical protein VHU14_06275 [Solirubrobacterales bacterium]|jgi:hypothetical protein|nr:hypothetical protein [Solirubrobacterales bacterium]
MGKKPKVQTDAAVQAATRKAKATPPASSQDETPIFCFRYADRATKEAWQFRPSDKEASKLVDFLCDITGATWREIEGMTSGGHRKHHAQELKGITRKAKKDAERRKLAERFGDELFRFRLGSKRRLWGFRKARTFHVVWWDPNHKVYPTEPS